MKLNMKKAFTLVEMLIVIVIIGILAAALIPKLTGVQGRARDVARKADLNQESTALSTYALDNNGQYPTAAANAAWTTGATTLSGLYSNGYLKSLPEEKQANTMLYKYATNAAGTVFAVAAVSEGGAQNANWSGTSLSADPVVISTLSGATNAGGVTLCTTFTDGGCVGTAKSGQARVVVSN